MAREPVTIVEIDVDTCSRVFGVGGCPAALGGAVVRKCYNTFATCAAPAAFAKQVKTLRFADPLAGLPKGGPTYFPALVSVSMISGTVNIAGSDENLSALGRLGTVEMEFADFPYHDRELDPYQAERLTGAAQIDEPGYDPATRGTYFGKLRARWPYYSGRSGRLVQAYLEKGAIVDPVSRAFVITEFSFPDDAWRVKVEGRDPLWLLDSDRALYPPPSEGVLFAAITAGDTALTLTPVGVGAKYPASGRAGIGSELVSYTRAGDVVTLTGRGLSGTVAAAHSVGDSFQVAGSFDGVRLDDAMSQILQAVPNFPTGFIPAAEWAAEVTRWMPEVLLKTDILTPTGAAKLVGELAILGVSIWWDDVAQKVRLKVNRPPDGDTVYQISDGANLKALSLEDRNGARLTEVLFFSVQADPSKSATSADNFTRAGYVVDMTAKNANAYGDTRVRRVFSRWLNRGADSDVLVLSARLLRRFSSAPFQARMRLDAKDSAIGLTDVLSVTSRQIVDATGKPVPTLMQVISRSEPEPGHEIELVAQSYQFLGRYGYATANTQGSYATATAAERAAGCFAVDDTTLTFPDGSGPYEAI